MRKAVIGALTIGVLLVMGALRAADLWSFRVVREALKGLADTLVVGTPFHAVVEPFSYSS